MLRYATLRYATLRYAMLCYAVIYDHDSDKAPTITSSVPWPLLTGRSRPSWPPRPGPPGAAVRRRWRTSSWRGRTRARTRQRMRARPLRRKARRRGPASAQCAPPTFATSRVVGAVARQAGGVTQTKPTAATHPSPGRTSASAARGRQRVATSASAARGQKVTSASAARGRQEAATAASAARGQEVATLASNAIQPGDVGFGGARPKR